MLLNVSLKLLLSIALLEVSAIAQETKSTDSQAAIARGVEIILSMQEGEGKDQWPYEGVYRVRGAIPIGYQVGGTAIAGNALLLAPDYGDDPDRQAAIKRGATFIVNSIDHKLMAHHFEARYDVRGWGYAYGLNHLLLLKKLKLVPKGLNDQVEAAIRFFIDGIETTSIPERGGWNYARRAGFDKPGAPSPFMTGSTLQALFEAVSQGYRVNDKVITDGLDSLEAARTPIGSFVYSGDQGNRSRAAVPGATGRMAIAESTLYLAGRSSIDRVRSSVDAFIVHWKWLDARRAKKDTHKPPYGIAPYYFYYAHYYAAQAVELLPENERQEYRNHIKELLFSVQLDDGSWNDRVFPRTANYSTAMAIQALMMADAPKPARLQGNSSDTP
ncbi:MAG: hypothetical protein IH984_06570 [Planctomycetes bacterium]|nr:hypothetical protein [Planctomycetota bacterium]